jgi:hypothetical protein
MPCSGPCPTGQHHSGLWNGVLTFSVCEEAVGLAAEIAGVIAGVSASASVLPASNFGEV